MCVCFRVPLPVLLHVCIYLCVCSSLISNRFSSVSPFNGALKTIFGFYAFTSDTFSAFSRTVWLFFHCYFLKFSFSSSHRSVVSPHILCLFDFPGAFPVSFSRFSAHSLLVPRLLRHLLLQHIFTHLHFCQQRFSSRVFTAPISP